MGFPKNSFAASATSKEAAARRSQARSSDLSEGTRTHLGVDPVWQIHADRAVRPSDDAKVVPTQGYRHDFLSRLRRPKATGPRPYGAASRETLLDVFNGPDRRAWGNEVDLVRETITTAMPAGHTAYTRAHRYPRAEEAPLDFEDLRLTMACTGRAWLNPPIPQEGHSTSKTVDVYASRWRHLNKSSIANGIHHDPAISSSESRARSLRTKVHGVFRRIECSTSARRDLWLNRRLAGFYERELSPDICDCSGYSAVPSAIRALTRILSGRAPPGAWFYERESRSQKPTSIRPAMPGRPLEAEKIHRQAGDRCEHWWRQCHRTCVLR